MGNVNFFLKDKKKSQTSVVAVVRYKGERYQVATGTSVLKEYWNSATHRCRKVREYKDWSTINEQLDLIETNLKSLFNEYTSKQIIPSKDEFRNDYAGLNLPQKDKSSVTSFMSGYIKNNSNYEKNTKDKYTTALNWLIKFEEEHRVKLSFSKIDIHFYNKFKSWFLQKTYKKKVGDEIETRHYSLNYFGSIIKCLKVVMNESGNDGDRLHDSQEHKHKKFKTDAEESDTIYLNESELKMIAGFNPTLEDLKKITREKREHNLNRKLESINRVNKRFLIGCYTALRVSDFKRIDEVNIKKNFIRIKPKKGTRKNEDVIIPIHPIVKKILGSGFDLSDKVTDTKINQHIKETCRMLKFDEPISVVRTEGGKQVERIYPKWQLVTSHTARRSGATNMYKAGIPAISIMKITGHRTEKSFLKYIKISQEENARILADHPFFK